MNHNILGKIIDQIAYNQWQQKINHIKHQYHSIYEISWTNNKFECLTFKDITSQQAYNFRYESICDIYRWYKNKWLVVAELPDNY